MTTLFRCRYADGCKDENCIHQRNHTERTECRFNRSCGYATHAECQVTYSNIENLKPPARKLRICPA